MADIHILRAHALGFVAARKVAQVWAQQARSEFLMDCTYTEGEDEDTVRFQRSGVNGTLQVRKDRFLLDARLGFLLGAFKERIESEIVNNLDALLATQTPSPKTPVARQTMAPKASRSKVISPKNQ